MDELSRQIEEAALAAAINPKTGQRFTLDEIIDRNASPALPTQGGDRPTWSERGRSLTSPRACFIQSAWCHWADGWTLYLVNGCVIQEVPGHKWAHHNVCTYAHLLPGWYIFDKEGKVVLHQAARSAFDPHPYECEWPDPDGLELLWQKYLLCLELGYLKLDPSSPWHVDGYAPCPNCNPDPPIPRIHSGLLPRVCVPLNTPWRSRAGGTDAPTMAEIHTLWRYHGKRDRDA